MVEVDFKGYLKEQGEYIGKYYSIGKVLGLNAINDIIKWAKAVERVFNVNLDEVVEAGSEVTIDLLRRIQFSYEVGEKQKENYSGAVEAYFVFVNGYELTE